LAARRTRQVQGEQRRFFYNPMWNYFGDRSVAGTYYDSRGGPLCFFWNMFDQVLLRPELVSHFKGNTVEIVTTAGSTNLITRLNRPNKDDASDHLPILFKLN
jgi:hypothetical protein